jgi:hypothetical protein
VGGSGIGRECGGGWWKPEIIWRLRQEKPKRPWFRFHLLTAVLRMIAAGGMLGLNMLFRNVTVPYGIGKARGWPNWEELHISWEAVKKSTPQTENGAKESLKLEGEVNKSPVFSRVLNFIIGLILLSAACIFSESILRRREARLRDSGLQRAAHIDPLHEAIGRWCSTSSGSVPED